MGVSIPEILEFNIMLSDAILPPPVVHHVNMVLQ